MLAFGALADRVGRRRIMLIGLVVLGFASFGTVFITTAAQLIAVRAAMGIAAAMTTPGSLALAFRLFDDDTMRVRATTVISAVGLVGLAIGPAVVVGVVAGTNVMRGLPASRTTIGAAMVDTASEVATAIGIAISGSILAALFAGSLTDAGWSAAQTAQFRTGVTVAGLVLTALAGALVAWGVARGRRARRTRVVFG
ncbi:MFS transporter [Agromyces intestinalis]|uniref:MFS transporter n=1 Tax=Agromyces intestinalis TaxID=2592652 RepID=A0A5C1YHM2_9MICO|nr:MFS transporter [Agromyces intestinalis]QEO15684.1 MFS transporter [Agromyces intestinalis]